MSATTETIFIEALSLPVKARTELAHRLLTSLEGHDVDGWQAEIKRRQQDFREGKAGEVSADEALRRAEAAIG